MHHSGFGNHMQCFLYFSIILIMVGGNLITLIKKVGRDERTEFTNSNLPACVRKFEVETNLLSILCTRGSISSIFGLLGLGGNPRYVKGKPPT
jgi:hypothetical protein